ncbi:MAG TPA: hypothetical protein VFC15_10930 [Candidatus Limnocylindrales bacterium]|jgi:hypothetical protein|nr:hypothetical protein [Candidatus Limnocylindrales bacterium]HZM10713.1 hypothetical protein [Candidatus Limnocylindrales bacterium]
MMQQQQGPKLYSCVVQHDNGQAPNPYFGVCTLCLCKFRECPTQRRSIVEKAKKGDWIFGTGGADRGKSAGHGKLIYAMQVDEKVTRWEYFTDDRFKEKKPLKTRNYKQTRGDNKRPRNAFEKHEQFALISRHFYYFGRDAISIPKDFNLEKKFQGYRYNFPPTDMRRFVEWIEKRRKPGRRGEPCYREFDEPKGNNKCKLSC